MAFALAIISDCMTRQNVDDIPLRAPRYSIRPFPPYRFLPGRDPHPTANPQGHSYVPPGHHEAPVGWKPPEEWRTCQEYLYGCDLHNHGYWWEAHEAWEGLWRVCPRDSVQKRFLQGLIQVAACHLKLQLGNREGIERLRESMHGHVHAALADIGADRYMGLDLATFVKRVDEYFDEALGCPGKPRHELDHFPYVTLL